jgi:hypothetical protein
MPLLALPPLSVLVIMLNWLWPIRSKRSPALVGLIAPARFE